MLEPEEVITTVRDLWSRHRDELAGHDRVYNFVKGKYGTPDVPDGAGDELKDLAKLSRKNILTLVRDAFTNPLCVVGFRSPGDDDNNAEVWKLWQAQKLDARQAEVYRAAVTYGTGYAVISREGIRFRTPRQVFAVYADAALDEWPVYALESWVDYSSKKPVRRGRLFDETYVYDVDLGTVSESSAKAERANSLSRRFTITIPEGSEPEPHGLEHPPVVRFLNTRDAEDLVEGEIEPLIDDQKAINAVNFDRLVVSRFGAFPQKYVIGWAPATPSELVKASAQSVMAFEDADVKAGTFEAASVESYNSLLVEQIVHVALRASLPPFGLTGSFANLAVDALAQIAKPYSDKLSSKQSSFGESMEQTMRAFAALSGVEVPEDAEAVWAEVEARSFAQVVDGITKLAAARVPIEDLLEDIPGWTQQRVQRARAGVRRAAGRAIAAGLAEPRPAQVTDEPGVGAP